jgi:hypothetical protein
MFLVTAWETMHRVPSSENPMLFYPKIDGMSLMRMNLLSFEVKQLFLISNSSVES